MDLKPRPNYQRYLQVLGQMSSGQRLKQAFELSDMTKRLLRHRLIERFPELSEADRHKLYLKQLDKCHNKNF